MENQNMPNKYAFFLKLAELTLNNAKQFLNDSKLLRDNRSFGHAYSLAVLGFEELSKCWVVLTLYIGGFKEEDEEIVLSTTNHTFKQIFGWSILASFIQSEYLETTKYRTRIKELGSQLTKGILSYKAYTKKLNEIVTEESKTSELAKAIIDLEDVINKINNDSAVMEKRKQEGFYVDYNIPSRIILNTPDSFNLEKTKFIETFDFFLQFSQNFYLGIKENRKRKSIQKGIQDLRRAMGAIRKSMEELDDD